MKTYMFPDVNAGILRSEFEGLVLPQFVIRILSLFPLGDMEAPIDSTPNFSSLLSAMRKLTLNHIEQGVFPCADFELTEAEVNALFCPSVLISQMKTANPDLFVQLDEFYVESKEGFSEFQDFILDLFDDTIDPPKLEFPILTP